MNRIAYSVNLWFKRYMKKRYYRSGKNNSESRLSCPVHYPELTAGADNVLKKIFSQIGVPEKQPFTPDPFQLEALDAINTSDCLVAAPTGAGKTWIAEQAAKRILENNGKVPPRSVQRAAQEAPPANVPLTTIPSAERRKGSDGT